MLAYNKQMFTATGFCPLTVYFGFTLSLSVDHFAMVTHLWPTLYNLGYRHCRYVTFLKTVINEFLKNVEVAFFGVILDLRRDWSFSRASSGLLRGAKWFYTDVSGLPIGPINPSRWDDIPDTAV